MSAQPTLEQRVAVLEKIVAELQRRLDELAPPGNWVEQVSGSMKDMPEFEEAMRLGREALRRGEMEEGEGPPA